MPDFMKPEIEKNEKKKKKTSNVIKLLKLTGGDAGRKTSSKARIT